MCEARVVAVALGSVRAISAVRLNLPKDLSKESSRKGVLKVSQVYLLIIIIVVMMVVFGIIIMTIGIVIIIIIVIT